MTDYLLFTYLIQVISKPPGLFCAMIASQLSPPNSSVFAMISRTILASASLLFVAGTALFEAPSAFAAPSESGWIIDQHSEERGRTNIKWTEKSMVLTSKLMSAILVAPKFDATFFNESTRKYVLIPHADWAKRYAPGKKAIKGPFPGEMIAGYKTSKYTWPTKNPHKSVELWATKDLPMSPPLQEFVSSTIGIPPTIGMPLKMVTKFDDRPSRMDMETKAIKKSKIPKTAFELPKGFKKVKNEMELLLGGDDDNDINSFIK